MSGDPADLGVCEASAALAAGAVSSEELTVACLERIASRDAHYSAWLRVYEEDAIASAREADVRRARGAHGPLTGIPVGLKDTIGVAGRPLTADSAVLEDNIAQVDATVWSRLDAAGMVLLGHLHCGEFACGTWGVNPWGPQFNPTGSSSGSGVALATRQVAATIGGDSRGSIRGPSAFMNLTSVKPSFGLVSCAGAIPITFSYDVLGPMARSAADCALLLTAIAGRDPLDRATIGTPEDLAYEVAPRAGRSPLADVRIGRPRFADGFLAAGVAEIWERVEGELVALGATLVPFDRPHNPLEDFGGTGAGWRTILGAEAAAIHEQFAERQHLYRDEIKTILNETMAVAGTALQYVRAQIKRAELVTTWHGIFEELRLDAVLEPASAAEAPLLRPTHPDEQQRDLTMTPLLFGMWNDANFPVVSLPAGLSSTDGGPVGMQLVGLPFTERTLLAIAVDFQAATEYHAMIPPDLDVPGRPPFSRRRVEAGPQPPFRTVPSPLEALLPT